jgi:protein involved in temperature-dependent protein secretion
VGLGLELVPERVKLRRLARTVRQRLRQQPVRQPRVSGEQWPVEVGPDHAARAAALVAALSVVAEAGEHATERG